MSNMLERENHERRGYVSAQGICRNRSQAADTKTGEKAKIDIAYKQLKYLTTSIHFRHNEQLVIPALAKSLSLGHTPVREALIRLHAEAIIKSEWHRGYFASYPGLQEAVDLYRILSTLMQEDVRRSGDQFQTQDAVQTSAHAVRLENLHNPAEASSIYGWAVAIEHSLLHLLDIPTAGEVRQIYLNLFDRTRCVRLVALRNLDFRLSYRDMILAAFAGAKERDFRPRMILIDRQFRDIVSRVPELVKEMHWLVSQR